MASFWYAKGIQKVLNGTVHPTSDTLTAYLIDTADYTADQAAHEHVSDIAAGARVASAALANVTVGANGVLDADDTVFTSVTGDSCEAVVIVQTQSPESDGHLLLYLDGIALTPDGTNVTCQWPADANKIARLFVP